MAEFFYDCKDVNKITNLQLIDENNKCKNHFFLSYDASGYWKESLILHQEDIRNR